MKFDEFLKKLKTPIGKRSFDKVANVAEDEDLSIELEEANNFALSSKSIKLKLIGSAETDSEDEGPKNCQKTSTTNARDGEFTVPHNDFGRKIYNSPTKNIRQPHNSSAVHSKPSLKNMLGIGVESGSGSNHSHDLNLGLGGESNGAHNNNQDEEPQPEAQLLGNRPTLFVVEHHQRRSNGFLFGLGKIRLCLILAMIIFILTIILAVTAVFIMDSKAIEGRGNGDNQNKTTEDKIFRRKNQENSPILDIKEFGQPVENHTQDSALMKLLHENATTAVVPSYVFFSQIPEKINISHKLIRESYVNALNTFTMIGNDNNNKIPSDLNPPEDYLLEQHALVMELAYKDIVNKLNLSIEQANQGDNLLRNASLPADICPGLISNKPHCEKTNNEYRSLDGTCNHLSEDGLRWGSVNEPYRRLVFPEYADGISDPRSRGNQGALLPSARLVSTAVHNDDGFRKVPDDEVSSMLPLWAHFISHDIMNTAKFTSKQDSDCCDTGANGSVNNLGNCFPILVPPEDPFYHNKSISCLNFHRAAPYASCNFGPREQINQATSFIDGSHIYGVTSEILKSLRVNDPLKLGQMKLDKNNLLPSRNNSANGTLCYEGQKYMPSSDADQCFIGGDDRLNDLVTLTALQTIWVRHHNQLAEQLSSLNKQWNDEKVFQETRRIVIAQIQHITFNEFLPVLLGPELISEDLLLKSNYSNNSNPYYQGFDIKLNPGISNEFSIAFQFYISMMQNLIKNISLNREKKSFALLQMVMNPFLLKRDEELLDSLLKGASTYPAMKVDVHISGYITNQVVQFQNKEYGRDLIAFTIQKGRDQGIPPYLEVARKCGLEWEEKDGNFSSIQTIWDKNAFTMVKSVYKTLKDVDLFTGLLSELPTNGSRVGPTLSCILNDQFSRLRNGDMSWYEGDISLQHFTPEQLKEIRKTTLAKVICNNSDKIRTFQPKIMHLPNNDDNAVVHCDKLLNTQMNAWKDSQSHYNSYDIHGHHKHNSHTSDNKETETDDDWGRESNNSLVRRPTVLMNCAVDLTFPATVDTKTTWWKMVHAVIYAMRGWIAFVAFIDFSNAIRCFIDTEDFLKSGLFSNSETDENEQVTSITARLMGRYYFLNCFVMGHCALFIHHLPIISIGIFSLSLSIFLHGSEAFYYYTAPVNFYVLFPILVAFFTIVCLLIAPMYLETGQKKKKMMVQLDEDEEEDEETRVIKERQAQAFPNFPNRLKKTN